MKQTSKLYQVRRQIAKLVRRLWELGYVLETQGNMSVRLGLDQIAITPSKVPRSRTTAKDILILDGEGNILEGKHRPSIETPTHLAIYKARADVAAIIHTHSIYASAIAAVHGALPAFLEGQVRHLRGDITTAPYAPAGSEELARNVVGVLAEKNAVLLANHGVFVVGKSLDEAFRNALLVEKAAQIYVLAKLIGQPQPLPDEVVAQQRKLFEEHKDV